MSSITRFLKKEEFPAWNKYVDEHPEGTIFHKTDWLQLIDHDITICVIVNDEKIRAGVALIKTAKNGVSGYHIPPYTQYFSPLFGNAFPRNNSLTEEHFSINAILEEIKKAGHIDFKLPQGHHSILPYHWKGFESSVSITHIISGTLADYLKELNKNKVRELKKLQLQVSTGEITIEETIAESELIHLLQQTVERKGFDAKSTIAVNLVMKAGPSMSKKIIIRSREHGLLAFGFFPYDNKAVYNLINASVRVTDPVLKTVNLLLLYQAIEFALNSNRTFDFEGSMLPGVETFCRLMGGRQVPVYRVQKSSSLRYSLIRAAYQLKNDRKKA
jgi:hypothetical protein